MESLIAPTQHTCTDFNNVKRVYDTLNQAGEVASALKAYAKFFSDSTPDTASPSTTTIHETHFLNILHFLSLSTETHSSSTTLATLLSHVDQLDADAKERVGITLVVSLDKLSTANERHVVFQKLVALLQSFVMVRVANVDSKTPLSLCADEGIVTAISFLELLNDINNDNNYVSFGEFYNDAIKEVISMKEDYSRWKASSGFSFFNYPFLLDSQAKGEILKIENMITMRHELQDSFFRAMFIGVNSPYLHLEVRRDHVVRDAIAQLANKTCHDLKKQLRVTFVGEEGIDDGGIQKEFFQMVVKEIFSPKHGRLLGLAIYNANTLEIPFPVVLFKKLLHIPPTLSDLEELDPHLGKGLRTLLSYPHADFEDLYDRTFQIEYEGASQNRIVHDLKPNGGEVQLTMDNRDEFVDAYVDFVFNKAVATAFQSFSEGLYSVVERESLVSFRPEEFQQLVVGCSELDFKALENNAKYEGWEADSPIIKQFWEIVHAMSVEEQKQLLFFTTGSDRAPVGGLGNLAFVVVRNGPDSDRLPTSHTCYNVLLLNEYASKEKLEERLKKAIGRFHEVADVQMHSLLDDFDAIGEKCDAPGFDVLYSNGVLTFNTGVAGTYVINKQPPNKQIWLSSPISGPKRFDHLDGEWVDSKKADRLNELLETELKIVFKGIDVSITKESPEGKSFRACR
ncbi:putative E3 ubiquitin-protein ligase HTD2 [Podochytrium sp. JEL0797]|nr:putative E3 ubiquitin-protein ligase HTD2 [Podochytrium sp. JEL0797]